LARSRGLHSHLSLSNPGIYNMKTVLAKSVKIRGYRKREEYGPVAFPGALRKVQDQIPASIVFAFSRVSWKFRIFLLISICADVSTRRIKALILRKPIFWSFKFVLGPTTLDVIRYFPFRHWNPDSLLRTENSKLPGLSLPSVTRQGSYYSPIRLLDLT
jgi:hypothetical protein